MRRLSNLARCDIAEVEKGGLAAFVRLAWPVIEADDFVDNWHIDFVCAHLEAVTRGDIKKLLINIPPGCMKSLLVNVFWPVWEWIQDPKGKWHFSSADESLVLRDANKARELIDSDWFQERWGHKVAIIKARDKGAKRAETGHQFWTTARGLRFSSSVGGKAVGWHAKRQVIDDPNKPGDTREKSGVMLKKTNDWFSGTMSSRRSNYELFARVIIMQRLHDNDLTGYVLKSGDWVHIKLPMEFIPEERCVTKWGADPRKNKGELLWPDRMGAAVIAELKDPIKGLGHIDYEAQYQQNPMPPSGGIFQLDFFKKRHGGPRTLPESGLQWLQSWDMRFKNVTTSGNFVCGQVWAWKGATFYLIKEYRGRWSFSDTIKQVLIASKEFPQARLKLVEKKANGEAVVNVLESKISGLVLVDPGLESKESRANAVGPLFEAGNVWIPDPVLTGEFWVEDYVSEMTKFPRGQYDDRVDCTSQALTRMDNNGIAAFADAMKKLRGELQ